MNNEKKCIRCADIAKALGYKNITKGSRKILSWEETSFPNTQRNTGTISRLTRVLNNNFCIHESRDHTHRKDRWLHTISRWNIRAQISKQDTFRSIQMRTGVPLQQKIHVGEHEKHKKEKTLQLSEL